MKTRKAATNILLVLILLAPLTGCVGFAKEKIKDKLHVREPRIHKMSCPHCGYTSDIDTSTGLLTICSDCGSQYYIRDGQRNFLYKLKAGRITMEGEPRKFPEGQDYAAGGVPGEAAGSSVTGQVPEVPEVPSFAFGAPTATGGPKAVPYFSSGSKMFYGSTSVAVDTDWEAGRTELHEEAVKKTTPKPEPVPDTRVDMTPRPEVAPRTGDAMKSWSEFYGGNYSVAGVVTNSPSETEIKETDEIRPSDEFLVKEQFEIRESLLDDEDLEILKES